METKEREPAVPESRRTEGLACGRSTSSGSLVGCRRRRGRGAAQADGVGEGQRRLTVGKRCTVVLRSRHRYGGEGEAPLPRGKGREPTPAEGGGRQMQRWKAADRKGRWRNWSFAKQGRVYGPREAGHRRALGSVLFVE